MIAAAVLAGLLLVGLLFSVTILPRQIGQPMKWDWIPMPFEHLTEGESGKLAAWGRSLEEAGFLFVGDYRKEMPPPPAGAARQVQQMRVWLAADRRTWAYGAHTATFSTGAGPGVVRTSLTFGLLSRAASGRYVQIYNYGGDDSFERDPAQTYRRLPGCESLPALRSALTEAIAGEPLAEFLESEFVPTWKDLEQKELRSLLDRGYLRPEGDRAVGTARLRLIGSLVMVSPFRTGGRFARVMSLLVAGILFGLGAAFPRAYPATWAYLCLPADILLGRYGQADWTRWLIGAFVLVLVASAIEQWRHDRLRRRYS